MFQTSNLSETLIEAYQARRERGIAPPYAYDLAKKEITQRAARRMCPLPFDTPSMKRGEQTFEVEYNDVCITARWDYVDQEYAFEGVGKIDTVHRPYGVQRGGEEIDLGTARGHGNRTVLVLEYTWAQYFCDARKKSGVAYAQRAADEYIKRTRTWARDVVNGQCFDKEWRVECSALDFWENSPTFTWGEDGEAEAWVEDQLRYLVSKINHTSS